MEGQHPLDMHRPDAGAHRTGATDQPRRASPAAGGGNASRKVERGIGRSDGYQHRASNLAVVVEASHGRICGDHHERPPWPFGRDSELTKGGGSLKSGAKVTPKFSVVNTHK